MKKWIGIDVACSAEVTDDLAAVVVEEFETGAEITPQGIRFYLEENRFSESWQQRLQTLLDDFKKTFDLSLPLAYTHFLLTDDNWADSWKEHFKPLRVGRSFLICPTWEQVDPDPQDRVIRMDPGRAFGTGHHETTRLCLEWLEDRGTLEGLSLLDVGTGSGILAMGGALLGCRPVVGVDNDPEAVEVAEENVRLNSLDQKVRVLTGTASDLSRRFNIVLANIQALPLIEMAHDLNDRLEDAGTLVLSGILTEQKDRVRSAYEKENLSLLESRTLGEWCLLALTKPQR